MKRRALLGTLASLAVAGCTGPATQGTGPTTDPSTSSTTAPTTDPTTSPTTESPEQRVLGVPVEQADCPPFDDHTERVVCYPEHDTSPLSLSPSTDAADLPADVTFTLANDTGTKFMANFYGWSLWKREDGEWFHVAPQMVPQPLHTLPPGESHEWRASLARTDDLDANPSDEQDVSVSGLGGGEYAFAIDGWFEDESYEQKVGLGAHFQLNGGPVELTPTEGASASRDGDTVVVTTDAEPGEHEYRAALVVEKHGVPPERPVRRRITEQLVRPRPMGGEHSVYRNTLPFFEDGVERVRLETHTGTTPPFGVDEPRYLEHEGETYRITAEKLS